MRTEVAKLRSGQFGTWFAVFAVLLTVLSWHSATALTNTPTHGQSVATGITISPSQKNLTLNSGLILANTSVTVTNNSGTRLIGTVRLLDVDVQNASIGLFIAPSASNDQYALANWMTLPNGNTVNIADKQTITIPVQVDNRADLAPGGHYGAVVVAFGDPATIISSETKASFKEQLVSLLFVSKKGGERLGLDLLSLSTLHTHSLPDAVILNFKNTGNVHVVPYGYVTLATPSGKIVAKGTINTESTSILPGNSKLLETKLQSVATVSDSSSYKLTAHYRYDDQTTFNTKSIYIDYHRGINKLLITAIPLGLIIFVFIMLIVKQRHRKLR